MKEDCVIDCFPDGTPIPEWFSHPAEENATGGRRFSAVELGVLPGRPDVLQTEKLQKAIDEVAKQGGGTLVLSAGTYLSGSLFFRPGVHLHLEKDAILLGSTEIADFALVPTRLAGLSMNYFAALINADHCDGFTISGEGVLDGNGLPYWRHFWLRRKFNPDCHGVDEMRPRMLYVSNSDDVTIKGVEIRNSPFWTTHYYRCRRLTLENLRITSPAEPTPAPSTDAVDLDNCEYVLIRNCYFAVNDDGIALKGGIGPDADQRPENGANTHILIENCTFGFCHSCLTCGSETIHNRNVIMRNCEVNGALVVLRMKMRPDTPQLNEYFHLSGIRGVCIGEALSFASWTQYCEIQEILPSSGEHILVDNMNMVCKKIYYLAGEDEFKLADIRVQNSSFSVSDQQLTAHDEIVFLNIKGVDNEDSEKH